MIHTISHGVYGESVLISGPTPDDVAYDVMEYEASHPGAEVGPTVPRVTGEYGAFVWAIKAMASDII